MTCCLQTVYPPDKPITLSVAAFKRKTPSNGALLYIKVCVCVCVAPELAVQMWVSAVRKWIERPVYNCR